MNDKVGFKPMPSDLVLTLFFPIYTHTHTSTHMHTHTHTYIHILPIHKVAVCAYIDNNSLHQIFIDLPLPVLGTVPGDG